MNDLSPCKDCGSARQSRHIARCDDCHAVIRKKLHTEYYQRPEVKEKLREYLRERYQKRKMAMASET